MKHVCKICNSEETIRSMAMHLKWNHQIKTNEYIEKYGEFRPKNINNNNLLNLGIKCEICNEKIKNNRQLMYHISTKHKNIPKTDYILKYLIKGTHPLCKCGCGEKVTIIPHGLLDKNNIIKYHTDYIKGHWDWVKPNWISHSQETKDIMRKIKIDKLKEDPSSFFEKTSKGEIDLLNFIQSLGFNIVPNEREILCGKELDIFIPQLNIAIEYNGIYFHSDKFKNKNDHLNKTKECELKGIRLIHIWESDWLYRNEIIKSNLINILNKTPNKIYARKCEIREISSKISNEFLINNHIQGNCLSKINLGLYYNNELISVMTFGKLRKNLGNISQKDHYELLRFCNKLNTSVIGGASKLFKYFLKNYKPKNIISYANRDWSKGNLYDKLGFKLINYTPPGYHYYKSKIKYNRFNFRKDILVKQGYDSNKTEFQIMDELGYNRVWNCGNIKYEYFLP